MFAINDMKAAVLAIYDKHIIQKCKAFVDSEQTAMKCLCGHITVSGIETECAISYVVDYIIFYRARRKDPASLRLLI